MAPAVTCSLLNEGGDGWTVGAVIAAPRAPPRRSEEAARQNRGHELTRHLVIRSRGGSVFLLLLLPLLLFLIISSTPFLLPSHLPFALPLLPPPILLFPPSSSENLSITSSDMLGRPLHSCKASSTLALFIHAFFFIYMFFYTCIIPSSREWTNEQTEIYIFIHAHGQKVENNLASYTSGLTAWRATSYYYYSSCAAALVFLASRMKCFT